MKVYIDITNLMAVDFLTGIQRVVREILVRLLKYDDFELVLLRYYPAKDIFEILDNEIFYEYFKQSVGHKKDMETGRYLYVKNFEQNAVFFEIDSVWSSSYRRSLLLPELKEQGLKIVTYIYDTIPIIHPQFCHVNTLYKFMDYFGANLQYADTFIVSTQSVLDSVYEISDRIGGRRIPGYVSWLGADFSATSSETFIDERVIRLVQEKKKYVLTVGTIEPRKNHKILLDAFEKKLFAENVCLVFAGRIGWNVEELEDRIRKHPCLEETFYYFEGLNDASIDYLYRNAFFVGFPTYDEGFGLPMIEAFERGIPVIASDCKVLREVGGENAVYFETESADSFIKTLQEFLQNPEKYYNLKSKVEKFVPFTWDQTAERIAKVLNGFDHERSRLQVNIRQMVVLSARCQDVCATLPYVEHFMPFIQELVLCCPDSMKESFLKAYSGSLKITIITDNMLLDGHALPVDHQARNFFLRSLVMWRDEIDPVFLMSDDDYRPLEKIEENVFLNNGRYQAYYCHSLKTWRGTAGKMTSYDLGMFNTLKFLEEHRYPVMQYSSHMPQIIDKKKYQEFLLSHKGIELKGVDEWSSYFNWLQDTYPQMIDSRPYLTMCWPGAPTDWKVEVAPDRYLFENYYEELYGENKIFNGFSKSFHSGIESENAEKKRLFADRQLLYMKYENVFEQYKELYKHQYREIPSFVFIANERLEIHIPRYIMLPFNGFIRLPAILYVENGGEDMLLKFSYYYEHGGVKIFELNDMVTMCAEKNTEFEIPLFSNMNCRGEMNLYILVEYKGERYERKLRVSIVNAESFWNGQANS